MLKSTQITVAGYPMTLSRLHRTVLLMFLASFPFFLCAEVNDSSSSLQFITLGTASGPDSIPNRSHPANALVTDKHLYLVDAGDGAVTQLAKAGRRLPEVDGLFLSHLHFDHTAGVLAVLGLRMQLEEKKTLKIYGPPGTLTFIDGLIAGMEPAMQAGYGLPRPAWEPRVSVFELRHNDVIELEGLTVKAAQNSHYQNQMNTSEKPGYVSLSFRFEEANRSIVYTGDTGPSDAVTELASNADVLVSEMMDIEVSLSNIKNINPNMPAETVKAIEAHFRAHHVTPEQVAAMANEAKVKTLVITHFAPGADTPAQTEKYRQQINKTFKGRVEFANDLDRF